MQYNKRNFGEQKDSLTLSPYNDDLGSSEMPPIEPLFLITEGGDNYISEADDFFIAEQLGT